MTPIVVVIGRSPQTIAIGLRNAGYEVVSFQDPGLALRTLFTTQAVPFLDLLVVAIALPNLAGYEVIRQFRRHPEYEMLPIIAISERGDLLARFRARRAGATACLQQPFKMQELVALVQQLLSRQSR